MKRKRKIRCRYRSHEIRQLTVSKPYKIEKHVFKEPISLSSDEFEDVLNIYCDNNNVSISAPVIYSVTKPHFKI